MGRCIYLFIKLYITYHQNCVSHVVASLVDVMPQTKWL
jgi:hypothetical protein